MTGHEIVGHDEWARRRKALLEREKTFNLERDRLSVERRALPWERIEKDYRFETTDGTKTLADLFAGRSQLLVYHFMYGADWDAGCPSCSWWADNFERNVIHLAHRDITMLAVSRAALGKLEAYKKRMGWTFEWASSTGSDFNFDFGVSFDKKAVEDGPVYYNYEKQSFPSEEAPGLSAFLLDDGSVYHTYSTYARGLDMLNAGYHLMDVAPRGRDEDDLDYSMAWLRRRDEYQTD